MRRYLAAVGLLVLGLPASCVGTDEPKALSILPCVPHERVGCRCPEDGSRGLRECAGNGSGFGACTRCGTACTLHPDCGGCVDCFESCICQSEGNVEGCRETCLVGADNLSTSGASSVIASCSDPSLPHG